MELSIGRLGNALNAKIYFNRHFHLGHVLNAFIIYAAGVIFKTD
jgi:hypothetical protein